MTAWSTLRPTVRALLRSPAFTVATVTTLGLGMGASAAIFTLIQRVVVDPLPYPDAARLVRLKNPVPGVGAGEEWDLSLAQYFYYGQHVKGIDRIGIYRTEGRNFTAGGAPERARVATMSASMNELIGSRAKLGRVSSADDDRPGAPAVAVLSGSFWRRAFGSDPTVVGRTIHLDDRPVIVIGVMADGVTLPADRGQGAHTGTDVWLPMQLDPAGPFYNHHAYPAIARLRAGTTAREAQAEMLRLLPELPAQFPSAYSQGFLDRYGFHTAAYDLKSYVIGDIASRLWMLFGAVWLVLLIACANAANLMLVRLEARRREFAIRTALGAGWRALAGETLRESAVLALSGAAVAAALGTMATRALVALSPPGVPRLEHLTFDWRALAYATAVGVLVAALQGLMASFQVRHSAAWSAMGEGGRGGTASVDRRRLRNGLVVAQVALALVLVAGAGLLLRSFAQLQRVNPGFDSQGVMTVELYLPEMRYDSLYEAWRFYDDVLQRVRALPGVTNAAMAEDVPLRGGYGCTVQGFEDASVYQRIKEEGRTTCAGQISVTPGTFVALGIPLLAGRDLTDGDNLNPDVGAVVVSKAFAERFWPGQNPIGQGVAANGQTNGKFYHVVGLVGDVPGVSVEDPPEIAIYYPIVSIPGNSRWYQSSMRLIVRTTSRDVGSILPAVRQAVSAVDPTIPLANAQSMEDIVEQSMGRVRFTMLLLGVAGLVALVLAGVGLYGLVSYVVSRRTGELGVRLALGALPRQVEGLVVRDAARLAVTGVAIGLIGAVVFARLLRGLLFGVATWDPMSYLGAALTLGVVALLAAWVPARRAAKVDPTVALRHE